MSEQTLLLDGPSSPPPLPRPPASTRSPGLGHWPPNGLHFILSRVTLLCSKPRSGPSHYSNKARTLTGTGLDLPSSR